MSKALFAVKGGPVFEGESFGAPISVSGEVVFTTSLVGYPESMTDPSYRGQILVFTQPLIGNYGVPSTEERDEYHLLKYFESPHIHVKAIVVADYAYRYSHWTAVESLQNWCQREGIAAITGVDTRAVVQYLREQGSSLGRITIEDDQPVPYINPLETNLVAEVTTKKPFCVSYPSVAKANIALIDCGVKENIIRSLVQRGVNVIVFPYDYRIQDVAGEYDGLFLSNGPGNPEMCKATIANLKELLHDPTYSDLPIFGICLGHQLLALASGAATHKLKYGNRAHNIPAMDLVNGKCHITSQNHGFAVDPESLPCDQWRPYFVNLNDKSNEGIIHLTRPVFSTQFHPEAKGGPQDTCFLFDNFIANVRVYRKLHRAANYNMNTVSNVNAYDIGVSSEKLSKERVLF